MTNKPTLRPDPDSIVEVIVNPNSSGQGYDDAHKTHPCHDTITNNGYSYSHTTPVHQTSGTVTHVHTYQAGEHKISVHGHSQDWQSKVSSASGHSHVGSGVAALDKHLQNKSARYPELRQHLNELFDDGVNANHPNKCNIMRNFSAQKDVTSGNYLAQVSPLSTPDGSATRPDRNWDQYLIDQIGSLCRSAAVGSRVAQRVEGVGFCIELTKNAVNTTNLFAPDAMAEIRGVITQLVRRLDPGAVVEAVPDSGRVVGADNPNFRQHQEFVRILLRSRQLFRGLNMIGGIMLGDKPHEC